MTSTNTGGATVYGYPRQGANRQLKKATEAYWAGRTDADTLLSAARDLRLGRLVELRDAGLDEIPSNDFSLYDHVLDTAWLVGAIPRRHAAVGEGLDRYFAMARGAADVPPLEMTKWFDTNYHYLVPELGPDTEFTLDPTKPLSEFAEALEHGILTRPVVLGPISFLLLAKDPTGTSEPLALLDRLVPLYVDLLGQLRAAGAEWVQLDEPVLVTDQPAAVLERVAETYAALAAERVRPKILVASYFDRLGDALPVLADSPVEGLAIDFTGPATANLEHLAAIGGVPGKRLVAGVVNGRNIWAADLAAALTTLDTLYGLAGSLDVSASCSLLHVPLDVTLERDLHPEIAGWLAFARQKVAEVVTLRVGLAEGRAAIAEALGDNADRLASRVGSPIVRVPEVRDRAVTDADLHRASPYEKRRQAQQARLALPDLPTTTIGSFPQTSELRKARAELRAGRLSDEAYEDAMRAEIRSVIAAQEELGLDVLVHGEPERNDMVQYFAEQLAGFVATRHGWVQSYGTRYVRPPIIAGDVSRPAPMTVEWSTYAASLTPRPVKGMLTGPVTMLAWSFVRDDQPEAETARQVALALRDEVADLERAGIAVIQVDEPALRETLPLRQADRAAYLEWAVTSFTLATAGVRDETQIHTHMCYAEFGDVLQAIIDMDADVISLEAARSNMAIITDLTAAAYPNEVGPGVWDIHSPRVPSVEEIIGHLRTATASFPANRLWVNPDCGLKTRGYPEVHATLTNLVAATATVRSDL
ncbi:5-methyltetrahydropteroyltriglutamate--homocysteine S-methyltransferase [Actinokineospora globicatena]|uniref:5-methyltetrahydropteroyltriglutamate-- homocysteine S-methyltransferase n=1 Tax=Actinokineospora globicatena TaxID=103729 RepID=UPI0020A506A8|nr:5-methyltetrahydropteroyltriglutamate--homocysteine S-methyltransferase [Actinokineospora globicatena]MCP2304593.1 methionine synthase (B12-independent) [Actinokineospora globicatena]GLW78036.1 5-methyltetrahydropteroyltriglutamate--homocysteine methyltransferase [Actinokineospora globicatena]GLW85298.1 5-methyltetrahydropteroyltriglutamate--homocysteine methyltransferase [Actinokineospora globicatena]